MNKTLKRILVIGTVIGAVIYVVYNLLFYCDATCGDHRYWAEQQATFRASTASTSTPCTDTLKAGLPKGKLVGLIPKKIIHGEQNLALAITYSPEKFSDAEIDKYVQKILLRWLRLSKDEVNLIETDIVMYSRGIPMLHRADTPIRRLDRKSRYIDTKGVIIWDMEVFPQEEWQEGIYDFWFYFYYEDWFDRSLVCNPPLLPDIEGTDVKILLQSKTTE